MAITSSATPISSFLQPTIHHQNYHITFLRNRNFDTKTSQKKQSSLRIQAAKLPAGVYYLQLFCVLLPKVEPKFESPFLGFTRTAETWNSRACMIGLIGTFFVELIINKGILQAIGVDIGKGLDLPL